MHFHAPFFDSIHARLKNVGGPDKGTIQLIPKCHIIFFCFIINDFNSFGRKNSSLSELDDALKGILFLIHFVFQDCY